MFDNDKEELVTKLLIFEFITGGGLSQQGLPDSLAREGLLMLEALIDDLTFAAAFQITILLDWRFKQLTLPLNMKAVVVEKHQSVHEILPQLIEQTDFIWPIAPEMEAVLQRITDLVESKGKRLLNSSSAAVAICSDKLITAQILDQCGINVIDTVQLNQFSGDLRRQWVIKPKDGVGCLNNYLVSDNYEFGRVTRQIQQRAGYIIQPYIKGESLSLSCLFKQGKAWLLCCNRQQVSLQQTCFKLTACEVNISNNNMRLYQCLINQIAQAIPGLWGYVGIDIIQAEFDLPVVLEINPRLTTSYAGIAQALQFNVAHTVLDMVDKDPVIKKTRDQTVIVKC